MNKEILRLAIPNIISNISIPLLSTVDTMLMGRLSESQLGAVGVGAMIFNFIYWNFGFLRMGTTGITAQAFGKKDDSEIMQTLSRALLVALILAVVIFSLQVLSSTFSSVRERLLDTAGHASSFHGQSLELAAVFHCEGFRA